MKLSTSAYETAKLLVIEHLFGDTFFKDYSIVSCINEDECQNQVGSLYRIFNKKKKTDRKEYSLNFQLIFTTQHHQYWSMVTEWTFLNQNFLTLYVMQLRPPVLT